MLYNNLPKLDIIKNEFLHQPENFPKCLRTIMRAQLLLSIGLYGSISQRDLTELGFKYSSVIKILRDFKKQDLVEERYFLLYLTKLGKYYVKSLQVEPLLSGFITKISNDDLQIPRPLVERL